MGLFNGRLCVECVGAVRYYRHRHRTQDTTHVCMFHVYTVENERWM